jgi:hypothetical protein
LLNRLNIEFDGRKIKKLGAVEFSIEEIQKITGSLELSKTPNFNASALKELKDIHSEQYIKYISFSDISKSLADLSTAALDNIDIVCLIDEWSEWRRAPF